MLHTTALYAGITGLLLFALSFRVSMMRIKMRKTDGNISEGRLNNAVRLQANLTEYAPMAILLILLAETQLAPIWSLHVFGLMFLAGRALHLIGFTSRPKKPLLRISGMVLTYVMLAVSSITNIVLALF